MKEKSIANNRTGRPIGVHSLVYEHSSEPTHHNGLWSERNARRAVEANIGASLEVCRVGGIDAEDRTAARPRR